MRQWEHKTLKIVMGQHANEQTLEGPLNRAGQEGWEVVAAFDQDAGHGEMHHLWFVLKRPKGEASAFDREARSDAFAEAAPLKALD